MRRDIDEIIEQVEQRLPNVVVWQHQVNNPGADDDGIWFFTLPDVELSRYGVPKNVQVESSDGRCPFLIEHDDMTGGAAGAATAASVAEAVEKVVSYLVT